MSLRPLGRPFLVASFIRFIPLCWGADVFDVRLYHYQAIAILDHINPFLYRLSPAFSDVNQPFVYFPFSMFYAPGVLLLSQWLEIPFASVIKWAPVFFDLSILIVLYRTFHKQNQRLAVKIAWIYALCPVSILITAFHGNIIVS